MSGARRWMTFAWVVAVAVALFGSRVTWSAFSSATSSAGNTFAAGTVNLGDNDSEETMLTLTDAQPGATDTGCILVTYTGTLPASLRLRTTTSGALASYLQVTVTRGVDTSPAFDACIGFVPDNTNYLGLGAGVVYSGTLAAFPSTWTNGVLDPPAGPLESWTTGEARSYRVAVTLANDAAAQGASATAAFTWEARNQ